MLVAHKLLPRAGPCSLRTFEPRLRGRFHGGIDVEGFTAFAACCRTERCADPAWRTCRHALSAPGRKRPCGEGFFGCFPLAFRAKPQRLGSRASLMPAGVFRQDRDHWRARYQNKAAPRVLGK